MSVATRRRIPSYRHYKPKSLGVVRLDGRDHYLRAYDSPESWELYHRLIADWLAGKQVEPDAVVAGEADDPLTILPLSALLAHDGCFYIRLDLVTHHSTEKSACRAQ